MSLSQGIISVTHALKKGYLSLPLGSTLKVTSFASFLFRRRKAYVQHVDCKR